MAEAVKFLLAHKVQSVSAAEVPAAAAAAASSSAMYLSLEGCDVSGLEQFAKNNKATIVHREDLTQKEGGNLVQAADSKSKKDGTASSAKTVGSAVASHSSNKSVPTPPLALPRRGRMICFPPPSSLAKGTTRSTLRPL